MLKTLFLLTALSLLSDDDYRSREWAEGWLREYAGESLQQWQLVRALSGQTESPEFRTRCTRAWKNGLHKVVDLLLPPDHPLWPDAEHLYPLLDRTEIQRRINYENSAGPPLWCNWRIATREIMMEMLGATNDPALCAKWVEYACLEEKRMTWRWKAITHNGRLTQEMYDKAFAADPRIVNQRYFRNE